MSYQAPIQTLETIRENITHKAAIDATVTLEETDRRFAEVARERRLRNVRQYLRERAART